MDFPVFEERAEEAYQMEHWKTKDSVLLMTVGESWVEWVAWRETVVRV